VLAVQPLRILYVEDNDLVREVTAELLSTDGREIVSVPSAEEALKEFRDGGFDVVITDVSLPAMSGLDLARHIRGLRPEMPIIIASGYSLDLSSQNWGPTIRSIIKPFDGVDIDALISELCGAGTRGRPSGPEARS
jgi:CheY-like chemotaxis protein